MDMTRCSCRHVREKGPFFKCSLYLLYLAYDEMPTEDEQIGKKQVVVNLTLAEYKVSFKIKNL